MWIVFFVPLLHIDAQSPPFVQGEGYAAGNEEKGEPASIKVDKPAGAKEEDKSAGSRVSGGS